MLLIERFSQMLIKFVTGIRFFSRAISVSFKLRPVISEYYPETEYGYWVITEFFRILIEMKK